MTKCINIPSAASNRYYYTVPKTCTEFTDYIIDTLPLTLRSRVIQITEGDTELDEAVTQQFYGDKLDLTHKPEYFTVHESPLLKVVVEYDSAPVIEPMEEKTIRLAVRNLLPSQRILTCRWILPEGWKVEGRRTIPINRRVMVAGPAKEAEYRITAGELVEACNRLVVELTCDGQHDVMYIPVVLLG